MAKLGSGSKPIEDWIRDEKFYLSRSKGYDVGVPYTVDALIARTDQLKRNGVDPTSKSRDMDIFLFNDAIADNLAPREEWVCTYLFDEPLRFLDDTPIDEHGKTRLQGELRRFGAQKYHTSTENVVLNEELVTNYTNSNRLGDDFRNMALGRLGLRGAV